MLPPELLKATNPDAGEELQVIPGQYRETDVKVGRHVAISSGAIPVFLGRFESVYSNLGQANQIIGAACSHHRLLWIHPFLDGNGRVARLMCYAMLREGLQTQGLWSVGRGLARNEARELFSDIMLALRNRNYLMLMLGLMLLSITVGTRETLNLHANTYYWELVPAEIRYFALAALPAPIIGFFIAPFLHERFEKLNTGIAFIVLFSFFAAMPVILRMSGLFPENDSTLLLPLLLIFYVGQMTSGVMLIITAGSIIADVADEQDLLSGRRQEGVFYSARTFFGKATSGLGHLIAGITIDVIGFPVGAEPGSVDADKIFQLGLIEGPLAVIPALCAILFYMRFDLTRARHVEIQALIAEREASKP